MAVRLDHTSTSAVSVNYTTADGTASAGLDYIAASGTVTIPAGSAGSSFNIPTLDDNAYGEPSVETFQVSLSNPSGATLGPDNSATLKMQEDNEGVTGLPFSFVPISCPNCGCPNQPGDLVQSSVRYAVYHPEEDYPVVVNGPVDLNGPPPIVSPMPVRYADGTAVIAESDLYSAGFGFPWAQTRSWSNGVGYAQDGVNGSGWVDTYMPRMFQPGLSPNALPQTNGSSSGSAQPMDTPAVGIYLPSNGVNARYYDLVNGSYKGRFDDGTVFSVFADEEVQRRDDQEVQRS